MLMLETRIYRLCCQAVLYISSPSGRLLSLKEGHFHKTATMHVRFYSVLMLSKMMLTPNPAISREQIKTF